LAEKFQVSRTPIREAIRQLQSEGLVTVEPLRGATVTKLSKEEVGEIYSIRVILETYATELAANLFKDPHEKILLGDFKIRFKKYLEEEKYPEWLDTDIKFHLLIAEKSGNSNLFRILGDLKSRVHRYQFIAATSSQIIDEYTGDHQKIIDAILINDSKSASEHMRTHLENVRDNLIKFLNNFPKI
jgi:DNA-binding GntR family transcriptional regulator